LPLYLYPDNEDQQNIEGTAKRIPNLNKDIVNQIEEGLCLEFVADHELLKQVQHDKYFSPLDLLDYIYAVLHSPTYRDTYKEFLKIDFPRVPYPTNTDTFWQLVELGGELRQIHLLEHPVVEQYITQYPKEGDNVVTRKLTKTSIGYEPITDTHGKVWINDNQYFDNLPIVAWEFYIGGYQPAQKWLKDRKDRELNYEDILHYQKIIVALTETDRIMKVIDGVEVV
jgi:predicted helicase